MKRIGIISVMLAAALAAMSCKKDEETPVPPSLNGTLKLSQKFPAYVRNGDVFVIEPGGVSVPEYDHVNTVGYFYYLNLRSSKRDTSKLWKVVIPAADTLGPLTLYGYAYASGYSLKSVTSSTEIVNDNLNGTGSVRGFDIRITDKSITGDSGRPYYYTKIGEVDWLRQNLAEGPEGKAREDCECVSYIFGRYYTWDEARMVCPEGWELPTSADWDALGWEYPQSGDMMADVTFNGEKMWTYAPKVPITDKSRLSILPTGYAQFFNGKYTFTGLNRYAVFWTADEDEYDSDMAVARYFYYDRPEIQTGSFSKQSFAASVRCIKR